MIMLTRNSRHAVGSVNRGFFYGGIQILCHRRVSSHRGVSLCSWLPGQYLLAYEWFYPYYPVLHVTQSVCGEIVPALYIIGRYDQNYIKVLLAWSKNPLSLARRMKTLVAFLWSVTGASTQSMKYLRSITPLPYQGQVNDLYMLSAYLWDKYQLKDELHLIKIVMTQPCLFHHRPHPQYHNSTACHHTEGRIFFSSHF